MKSFYSFGPFVIIYSLILIFSLCFFIPIFAQYGFISTYSPNSTLYFDISNSYLSWLTPGFNHITSYFGYRNSPTKGASTYHGGIDIGAPERYKYNCQ